MRPSSTVLFFYHHLTFRHSPSLKGFISYSALTVGWYIWTFDPKR